MAKDKEPAPPTTRRIRLVADHLRAVGPYLHGQDYEVPAAVAERLVPARGFVDVDDPAAPLAPNPSPIPTEERPS